MSNSVEKSKEYKEWINEISSRYRSSQIKASVKVNDEMLRLYWSIGRDLNDKKESSSWGSHFYEYVSRDLKKQLPDVRCFSPRNLIYMHNFYQMYPEAGIAHQVDAQLNETCVFCIPWGHHKLLIDKCKSDKEKALFYVRKTLENNWSRAMLLNFLDVDLYERQGKAVSNFAITLPDRNSDLAQEITKDPYQFDFISIADNYREKELKDALMDRITEFLLELGNGFAFVGREVRIEVGSKEKYIDMLFFNTRLKCYVVLEVKACEFDASYTGQLGSYVVAVNHKLKEEWMEPTIGLLICKDMDKIDALYALESSSQPLGISSYELSQLIPEKYKGTLPSIEELEKEIE